MSPQRRCVAGDTAIDNSILDTILHQEAEIGDRVIYPIRVTNLNGEAKTYHLSLQDINHIGSYRIDPSPTFTVPAGGSETVFLYIDTAHFAPVGRNEIQLFLESEGKIEQIYSQLQTKTRNQPDEKMMTLEKHLAMLVKQEKIDLLEAKRWANDLKCFADAMQRG